MMSLDDFFRGFFGFHNPPGSFGHRRPQYDQDDSNQDDPCDNDDDDVTFRFHFSETEDLFRHFEDMFKNMGLADFPPPPMLPGSVIPGPDVKPGRSQNPRDKMLKEPNAFTDDPNPDCSKRPKVSEPILPYKDTEPSNKPFFFRDVFKIPKWGGVHPRDKQDKDLDGEISSEDFDKIVAESKSNPKKIVPVQPEQPRSYFKSVSISTVRGPDGKLEQRRTVRDGAGNEETTVIRSLGDQSHTVVTKRDNRGQEEQTETFSNINEKDMPEFTQDWKKNDHKTNDPGHSMVKPYYTPSRDSELPHQKDDASIFKNIFGFSFPKFRDT